MAGMFYSLQEAAEKLQCAEQGLKELVKQGKLREFRDGSNLLFKADEVEALAAEQAASPEIQGSPEPAPEPTEPAPEAEQPPEPAPEQEQPQQAPELAPEDEISLAPETGVPAAESGLTEADTAITAEGVSVLGETDKDYPVTDDTMAETMSATGASGPAGITPEASLEEIEEDVNLDSFGSGSGLLDLSLQADDTSLGGILDEIYTAEGEEQEPAKPGTAAELTAEAEKMMPSEELTAPQPAPEAAIVQAYAEPVPDVQSNTLGILLFLPLALLVYTAVVTVAGQRGVIPSILSKIQGLIWYIVVAAAVISALVVGASFMLTGDLGRGLKKPAKVKKPEKSKRSQGPLPAAPEGRAGE